MPYVRYNNTVANKAWLQKFVAATELISVQFISSLRIKIGLQYLEIL